MLNDRILKIVPILLLMIASVQAQGSLAEQIRQNETLLQKYPNSEFAPTVMFQLAELHYDYALQQYQQNMQAYEQRVRELPADTPLPPPPQPEMQQSIFYCEQLLQNYPDASNRDQILYRLAIANLDGGNEAEAAAAFELLVEDFPASTHAMDAHFRIGEYYFKQRQFERAIDAYAPCLQRENHSYYDMARYKTGWAFYNLENFDAAIDQFFQLVRGDSARTAFQQSRPDLYREAIQYMASSFFEQGGPDAARDFLSPHRRRDYSRAILERLTELYSERTFYHQAIATLRVLIDLYPLAPQTPDYYVQLVENRERAGEPERANRVRQEIVEVFAPGSGWQTAMPADSLQQRGLDLVRDQLAYLAQAAQAAAAETDSAAAYQQAIGYYDQFLTWFAADSLADDMLFYQADCFWALRDFEQSAAAYARLVNDYPDSDHAEESGYNRVLAHLHRQPDSTSEKSAHIAIPNMLASGDTVRVGIARPVQGELLQACNEFVVRFPQSRWLDQVLMTFAEQLNALNNIDAAVQAYAAVPSTSPLAVKAAMNAGNALFQAERFERAGDWFEKVETEFADSTDYRQRADRLAALAAFKLAEAETADGQSVRAGTRLLQTARTTDDAELQQRALFDAALQFKAADSLLMAVQVFEEVANRFPDSDIWGRAVFNAGLLSEQHGDFRQAADFYDRLIRQQPDSELAGRAVRNAAGCYEQLENWRRAEDLFRRLAAEYAEFPDDRIEGWCRAGEMAARQQRRADAERFYRAALAAYTHGEADPYFAAKAQFQLAEFQFENYQALRVEPPLRTTLGRKIDAFQQTVAAFTEAVQFQVVDWSLAATHRIGQSFEELATALLTAPLPDGLTDEQQTAYMQQLAERARPYREKAYETYQKNLQLAAAQQLNTEWVRASRVRIQVLAIELTGIPWKLETITTYRLP